MEIFVTLVIIVNVFLLYEIFSRGNKNNNLDSSDDNELSNKYLAQKIYNKCSELGIISISSKENIKKMMVVAKSFGVTDVIEAKNLYRSAEEEKLEEERKKIEFRRQGEFQCFLDEKEISRLVGREKYEYIYELSFGSKFSEKFSNALYDDSNIKEKFKLLNLSNVHYTVRDTGNFDVTFKCVLKEKIKLLNRDAILDGTLMISILDEDDNVVAIGYLNGDFICKGDLYDFSYYFKGFNTRNYEVTCCLVDGVSYDENKKYFVKFSPVNLWFIEDFNSRVKY